MKLTPAERDILVDLLVHGDNTSGNVAENVGLSRVHVSDLLSGRLSDRGLVENKGRGVYRLKIPGVAVARNLYE